MRSAAALELADGPEPLELAAFVERLARHALEAIVILRADGTVAGWNPRAAGLFGWATADPSGRPLTDAVPAPRHQARLRTAMRRCRAGGTLVATERVEVVARHSDGTMIPVEVGLTSFLDRGTLTLVAFVRDMAEQRVMERALRETEAHALELTERREIGEALRRLPYGRPADETADAVCRELLRLPGADVSVVYEFADDGSVTPIGVAGPAGLPIHVGESLPAQRADYLRGSATGPWIDEWQPRRGDSGYDRAWHDLGLRVAAYVPFGTGERTFGLLAVGSLQQIGTSGASRWLPAVTEFGAISAALLASELGSRRQLEGTRAQLNEIISSGAFEAVFQPIVRLGDNDVVGYEALTRFADGTSPDRWFAVAQAIGDGAALEAATMRRAFREAGALPSRAWLSLNLSPGRLADASLPGLLAEAGRRPLVLEITEDTPIDDYEVVRDVLDRLARGVDVAVDDAGAGFSSLRHIIELRPRYVKLDLQLVRGVDADPARQAMIAGMVFFARDAGCLLIAEGVETAAERDALRRLGVPFGQGYLFGKPAPAGSWGG